MTKELSYLMTQRISALAFALVAIACGTPAMAAEGVLHLRCDWKKLTDMKTLQAQPLSGSVDVFYDPISDLTGTMTKSGFDGSFVAGVHDKLIAGVAHYQADGAAAEQRVEINRYTGAIMNLVRTATTAQVLEGQCTRISGPDFGQGGSD